jgi:hypothetical protein
MNELNQFDTWIVKEPRMVQTYGFYHTSIPDPVSNISFFSVLYI